MKLVRFSLLALLIISFSSCGIFKGSGSKDTILKYNLSEGSKFSVDMESTSKIISEQMGQEIVVDAKSSSTVDFVVSETKENGNMVIDFSYSSMTQSAESPMGGGETDFSPIIDKPISMELTATGECNNFEGIDDLPDITNAMGETIRGDVYKQGVEQMFLKLPGTPAKKGTTWTEDISNETPYNGGNIKTTGEIVYTVIDETEVDGMPCLVIEGAATVKSSGEFTQQGMDIGLDRNGTSTSIIVFAYTKGMFLSMESSGKNEGIVDVPAANMTFPQTIETSASFKVNFH